MPAAGRLRQRVQCAADTPVIAMLPPGDFIEARALVHDLLGGLVPVKTRRDGRTVLAIAIDPASLFRATGSIADNVVAGAGFEPATFGL